MSRYIDADVLKYYGNHIGDEYEDRFHDVQWVYRNQIDEAPSIDIVRCKECKHLKIHNTKELYAVCTKWHIRFYPFEEDTRTHGCSWGERR